MDEDVYTSSNDQLSNENTSSEEDQEIWRNFKTTKRLWEGIKSYPGGRTKFLNDHMEAYVESKGKEMVELEKEIEQCKTELAETNAVMAALQVRYKQILSQAKEGKIVKRDEEKTKQIPETVTRAAREFHKWSKILNGVFTDAHYEYLESISGVPAVELKKFAESKHGYVSEDEALEFFTS